MDTSSIINEKMSPLNQLTPITDNLYVSGSTAVQSHKIIHNDITCIINVTADIPFLRIPNRDNVRIPIDDKVNLCHYFDIVADKIAETGHRGGKTLVHSANGKNRSVTLCIAYLMKYEGMSLRQAYYYIKARRSNAHPNTRYFKQLIEYERQLFGKASVAMINSPMAGVVPDVYEDELFYAMWKAKCKHNL